MLIWIGAGVVAVAVLTGASKLISEMKSSNSAARRPRRPWEVLP